MLRIRYETEDWREQIVGLIDDAEQRVGGPEGLATDAADYNDLADRLFHEVAARLSDSGVEYECAYQQSVGNFVIVQSGSDSERAAFDDAMAASLKALWPAILTQARAFADSLAEDEQAEAD